ncbi:hypothetical protein CYY_010027 [Polysphondylium violaceum]|uniref:TLDc domain-containing protein n=1 Tax=Polysphondylium violaceum TaxID=133409 RepID=A0A8J4PKF9_9MYCE|nr:hypothetical protein CYY_010027 [Polysphondylium violaceum]
MDKDKSPPQNMEGSKNRKHLSPIDAFQGIVQSHLQSLEQEIKDLEKRRDALLNVTKVIDVSVIPDPITLNIGGVKHQTTKATLSKIPNSFFDLMLSGQINIKPMTNEPNTYFIDRDGTHFNYILNYLRDEGDIQIPEDIRHCVRKEMEFYRINDHFKSDDTTTIIDQLNSLKLKLDDTTTITDQLTSIKLKLDETNEERKKELENLNQKFNLLIQSESSSILNYSEFKIISDWIDKTKLTNFELLYSASENNKFNASAFHLACVGKGATITVIETTDGCIFGGYNSQSWEILNDDKLSNIRRYYHGSCYYFYGDDKCFIFTLVNKHGIPPTKYLPDKDNGYYVGSNIEPPVFAYGYKDYGHNDIRIGEEFSHQMFPTTYIDTTGKGNTTLNPSSKFTIKHLEIYKCS